MGMSREVSKRSFLGKLASDLASVGVPEDTTAEVVPGQANDSESDPELHVDAGEFLKDPHGWVDQLAEQQWLCLDDPAEHVDRLLGEKALQRVPRLVLGKADLGDDGVIELVELIGDGELVGLGLPRNKVSGEGLAAIQSAPFFANLVELDLNWNDIDAEAVEQLTAIDSCKLRSLDISANDFEEEGARLIAEWAVAKQFQVLRLGYSIIADEGTIALADSPYLKNLEVLDLAGSRIGAEGAIALIESRNITKKTMLYLDNLVAKLKYLGPNYRNAIPRPQREQLVQKFGEKVVLDFYLGESLEASCRTIIDIALSGLGDEPNDYENQPGRGEPGVIDMSGNVEETEDEEDFEDEDDFEEDAYEDEDE